MSNLGHPDLFIKREDQTHEVYGGNKIRNLEFILADAKMNGINTLSTLVPFGSNFTAALTSQARLNGFKCDLNQFIAQRNAQIDFHESFCRRQKANLYTYSGLTGPLLAFSTQQFNYIKNIMSNEKTMIITPRVSTPGSRKGHGRA